MTDREAMKLALEAISALLYNDMNRVEIAMNAITALRQALERPQTPDDLLRQSEREGWRYAKECEAEVKRLRQALEQPEQEPEPVGYVYENSLQGMTLGYYLYAEIHPKNSTGRIPVYTTPLKREFVGLTYEEANEIALRHYGSKSPTDIYFARAIEAKLKEKNHD